MTKEEVIRVILNYYGIGFADLVEKTRKRKTIEIRRKAIYFILKHTKCSLDEAAEYLEYKKNSHATAFHHNKKCNEFIIFDKEYRKEIDVIDNSILMAESDGMKIITIDNYTIIIKKGIAIKLSEIEFNKLKEWNDDK